MRRIFGAVNSIHGCCWPASAMPAAPPLLTLLSKTSHYPRPARRSCSGMATFQYGWKGESGRYIVEDCINVF